MYTKEKEYYKEHRKNSVSSQTYSIARFDLLIISISGAGVYVVLETLKYSLAKGMDYSLLLKLCGAIFILAIILNFISQMTGEKANTYEIKWADEKLDEDDVKAAEYSTKAECYSSATRILNICSTVVMFIGLILLISYFFITF